MICTTIEQGQYLMKLGLKPETGDMHYTLSEDGTDNILYADNEVAHSDRVIPAWSLDKLFSLMPIIEEKGLEYIPIIRRSYGDPGYIAEYNSVYADAPLYFTVGCGTPMEAAFILMLWLFKEGRMTNEQN